MKMEGHFRLSEMPFANFGRAAERMGPGGGAGPCRIGQQMVVEGLSGVGRAVEELPGSVYNMDGTPGRSSALRGITLAWRDG